MTLETIRARATIVVAILATIFGVSALGLDIVLGGAVGPAGYFAIFGAMALGGIYAIYRTAPVFRYLAVTVMMSQIMALLVAAQGQPWQTDIHMAFFAALAIIALLYDIRAIVLGTVLVAVHHLGLGMALPELVFYAGGSFGRIALHAVILLIEAAGLIWMTHNTFHLFDLAQDQSERAQASASEARKLAADVQQSQQQHHQERMRTMSELRADFGSVVSAAAKGDFSRRVREDFEHEDLNMLANSINALVETVGQGLVETSVVLGAISSKDLTRRVEGQYLGAFGALKADTNAVADSLEGIIGEISSATSTLKRATSDLLSGANDLSDRTARQAASVEETGATVESLARTVNENAKRADDAGSAAALLVESASVGGQIMEKTTGAMDRITRSSREISGIIGMIDDIAFQTNLLALNASVEAARAGEAGKGFAVVAVEVRRLAQSAAEASAQVKALIEQSGSHVQEGVSLVSEAAQTLESIVMSARRTNDLMQAIARENNAQTQSIREVSNAVRQIDSITQHNAALVEESNAAIEQTEAQVRALDAIIRAFTRVGSAIESRKPNAGFQANGNAAVEAEWERF